MNIDLSQVATAGDYPQVTRLSGKPAAKSALVTTTRTDSTTQQQIMGGENAVFVDTRRLAGRVVLGCVYAPTLRGLASGDVDRSVIEMTAHIAAEVGARERPLKQKGHLTAVSPKFDQALWSGGDSVPPPHAPTKQTQCAKT